MNDSNPSTPAPRPSSSASPASRPSRRGWVIRLLGRCLFAAVVLATLAALFYTEEKVRGHWAWKKYRRQLEQQGYPLEVKALLQPSLPPEKNLALLPLFRPLYESTSKNRMPKGPEYVALNEQIAAPRQMAEKMGFPGLALPAASWRFAKLADPVKVLTAKPAGAGDAATNAPPPEKAAEIILEIYRQTLGPDLDKLQQAIQDRPRCDFHLQYETKDPFSLLLPHLAAFKSLAQHASIRAEAELFLRQSEAGLRDTRFGLQLTDSFHNEPLLITLLLQIAMREYALNNLWYGLATRQWNEAQLAGLQAHLETVQVLPAAYRALNFERILANRGLDTLMQARTRASSWFSGEADDTPLKGVTAGIFPQGWFYFEKINLQRFYAEDILPRIPQQETWMDLKRVDEHHQRLERQLRYTGPLKALWSHTLFAKLLLPAVGKVALKAANSQAAVNLALTACALERHRLAHGTYPPNLQALVPAFLKQVPMDPVNGQPLVYRLTGDGRFLLYSLGRNGVDDGGRVVTPKESEHWDLESDWVWTYSAQ